MFVILVGDVGVVEVMGGVDVVGCVSEVDVVLVMLMGEMVVVVGVMFDVGVDVCVVVL